MKKISKFFWSFFKKIFKRKIKISNIGEKNSEYEDWLGI